MDPTIVSVVSVIVSGIVSVAGSVISVVIAKNNIKHQEQILKRKMYVQRQIDVIEKYLSSVGKALDNISFKEFQETQGIIFLYVPDIYWDKIEQLNELVVVYINSDESYECDKYETYGVLAELSQSLHEYMKSIKE